MITSAIAIVLVLGGLIFFHELGHFAIARLFGMGVKAFSLGFGPRLAGFTSGNTEYKLSAIPLGGYVQLAGEAGEEDEEFPDEELFANVRRGSACALLPRGRSSISCSLSSSSGFCCLHRDRDTCSR